MGERQGTLPGSPRMASLLGESCWLGGIKQGNPSLKKTHRLLTERQRETERVMDVRFSWIQGITQTDTSNWRHSFDRQLKLLKRKKNEMRKNGAKVEPAHGEPAES